MQQTDSIITRSICLFIVLCMLGCGGTPIQPDDSRERMEDRRDKAFKELK